MVGVGAPLARTAQRPPGRDCDALLLRRGVAPQAADPGDALLADLLRDLPAFAPERRGPHGPVDEGAYRRFPVFETNADGVFCALQGRRLPAKRHPFGI